MEFIVGMRVMYRDAPGNDVYQFRPALPRATGSVIGSAPECVGVRWDNCGLCEHPQMTVAYYRPDRLQPLTGGF